MRSAEVARLASVACPAEDDAAGAGGIDRSRAESGRCGAGGPERVVPRQPGLLGVPARARIGNSVARAVVGTTRSCARVAPAIIWPPVWAVTQRARALDNRTAGRALSLGLRPWRAQRLARPTPARVGHRPAFATGELILLQL